VSSPNLAERAGLEMGDVVVAVNQQPITGFGDLFRLYRKVKADQSLSAVEVQLERQGQLVTKTYRIASQDIQWIAGTLRPLMPSVNLHTSDTLSS